MKAYGTAVEKQLVSEASAETGLHNRQIINWINNQKKKNRPSAGSGPSISKKRKISCRQKSGHDLFMSESMAALPKDWKKKERLAVANEEWVKIKNSAEGLAYKSRAKAVLKSDPSTLGKEEAKIFFRKVHKKLQQSLKNLESIGYESIVILYNKETGSAFRLGTDAGHMFLQKNQRVGVEFATFVGVEAENEDRKRLLKKVRKLFTTLYKELTGADRISYDNFRQGSIVVRGLPEGILVENVGSFSRPVCKSILEKSSSISFQFANLPSANGVAPSTEQPGLVSTEPLSSTDAGTTKLTIRTPAQHIGQSNVTPTKLVVPEAVAHPTLKVMAPTASPPIVTLTAPCTARPTVKYMAGAITQPRLVVVPPGLVSTEPLSSNDAGTTKLTIPTPAQHIGQSNVTPTKLVVPEAVAHPTLKVMAPTASRPIVTLTAPCTARPTVRYMAGAITQPRLVVVPPGLVSTEPLSSNDAGATKLTIPTPAQHIGQSNVTPTKLVVPEAVAHPTLKVMAPTASRPIVTLTAPCTARPTVRYMAGAITQPRLVVVPPGLVSTELLSSNDAGATKLTIPTPAQHIGQSNVTPTKLVVPEAVAHPTLKVMAPTASRPIVTLTAPCTARPTVKYMAGAITQPRLVVVPRPRLVVVPVRSVVRQAGRQVELVVRHSTS